MKLRAVPITRIYFIMLAALWPLVGINYLRHSDGSLLYNAFAGLMFANFLIFILLGIYINKKPVYWLGTAALALCILLTIFDDFGWADLIAVILFAIPLVIMLAKRKEFLPETP